MGLVAKHYVQAGMLHFLSQDLNQILGPTSCSCVLEADSGT